MRTKREMGKPSRTDLCRLSLTFSSEKSDSSVISFYRCVRNVRASNKTVNHTETHERVQFRTHYRAVCGNKCSLRPNVPATEKRQPPNPIICLLLFFPPSWHSDLIKSTAMWVAASEGHRARANSQHGLIARYVYFGVVSVLQRYVGVCFPSDLFGSLKMISAEGQNKDIQTGWKKHGIFYRICERTWKWSRIPCRRLAPRKKNPQT